MTAERECFDPARRSTPANTSGDSVMEVFSFIGLLYYLYLTQELRTLAFLCAPIPGDPVALHETHLLTTALCQGTIFMLRRAHRRIAKGQRPPT
jgi:hypothetical protein